MKNVHLICNAHIDPVWLWRWEEGCASALSTFRTVTRLLDEYPELTFNHNESILYDWVRKYDPALFERIQQFVAAGRWNIFGGWYLQPDCNMPAGESFVRNMLVGRRFFSEHFGKRPKTVINFDAFGHSRGLVQAYRQAGYENCIFCRPGKPLYPFPNQDFTWRGLDGSKILVHRSDENYNSVFGKVAQELEAFLEEKKDEPVTLFLWGVGDHGGGPSRKDLDNLRLLSTKCADRYSIQHSSAERYFDELLSTKPELPVVARGLNPVSEGCYTSQIRVKQAHRRLESDLYVTEKMCAQAGLAFDLPYPAEALKEAQKDLLFGEFHDALPGSGTQLVEEDTLRCLHHGQEIVARERMKAFMKLASKEAPVDPDGSCILVYNPHPFDITGPMAVETELPRQNWDWTFHYPRALVNGVEVPSQAVKEESNFRIDWRKQICFNTTLKASSITRIDIAYDALPGPDCPLCPEMAQDVPYVFENGRLHAVIDPATGMLTEYAVDGCVLARNMTLAVRSDIYNSWGLQENAHEPGGLFTLLSAEEGTKFSGIYGAQNVPSVRIIEHGAARTVIEAVLGYGDSKALVRYKLPASGDRMELDVKVWWREKDSYLKLEMDCFQGEKEHVGQIVFGREALALGHEAVSQKWCGVRGGENMLAVINDGCHGSSLNGDRLGVTLLRAAGYSCSDCNGKLAVREKCYHDRMDQGERRFGFALVGGRTEEVSLAIDQQALAFNERPFALSLNPCGDGSKAPAGLTIDAPNVMLSCFKQAEDGDGWIVRVYETQGMETSAVLNLPVCNAAKSIHLKPFEIQTLRLKNGAFEPCELLEGF